MGTGPAKASPATVTSGRVGRLGRASVRCSQDWNVYRFPTTGGVPLPRSSSSPRLMTSPPFLLCPEAGRAPLQVCVAWPLPSLALPHPATSVSDVVTGTGQPNSGPRMCSRTTDPLGSPLGCQLLQLAQMLCVMIDHHLDNIGNRHLAHRLMGARTVPVGQR